MDNTITILILFVKYHIHKAKYMSTILNMADCFHSFKHILCLANHDNKKKVVMLNKRTTHPMLRAWRGGSDVTCARSRAAAADAVTLTALRDGG